MAVTRRRFLALGAGGLLAGVAGGAGAAWYGLRNPCRVRLPDRLRDHPLVRAAFARLDPARIVDAHVHLVGVGAGGTGAWVNPSMTSWAHPIRGAKFLFYRNAACITDLDRADQDYADRLVALKREAFPDPGAKLLLLAFDHAYAGDGTVDLADSEFYVPAAYVFQLAAAHPDDFLPATSIHPYRADALDALDAHAAAGARAVKWLPNAQRIDPADPRCRPFYEKLAHLGIPLLTHAGEEQAVEADEAQLLGNPLRLRAALEAGATVIVAHCASLGTSPDLDRADQAVADNFELFLRLMAEPRWVGRLWGDVSALPQFNRCGEPLRRLLLSPELHGRLINGSDYPLPGVNPVIRTSTLVDRGYITAEERAVLNELFEWNALLFDFVLKRTLRVAEGGVEHRFADEIFQRRDFFTRVARP